MIHPLKITSTLADDTRYQIYEYMLQEKKPFTVQNIAEQFSIHPNVARLHLTKLSEINVIEADFMKTGKGGRPGRVYKASEQGVSLHFPRKDDYQLLTWTLQLLEELGADALTKCQQISYKDGFEQMRALVADTKVTRSLSFEQKIELLSISASLIGYVPVVKDTQNQKKITFAMHSCPYSSKIATHAATVCALHEAFLKGQVDALFENNEFVQMESMVHQCEYCKYEIIVSENK